MVGVEMRREDGETAAVPPAVQRKDSKDVGRVRRRGNGETREMRR